LLVGHRYHKVPGRSYTEGGKSKRARSAERHCPEESTAPGYTGERSEAWECKTNGIRWVMLRPQNKVCGFGLSPPKTSAQNLEAPHTHTHPRGVVVICSDLRVTVAGSNLLCVTFSACILSPETGTRGFIPRAALVIGRHTPICPLILEHSWISIYTSSAGVWFLTREWSKAPVYLGAPIEASATRGAPARFSVTYSEVLPKYHGTRKPLCAWCTSNLPRASLFHGSAVL